MAWYMILAAALYALGMGWDFFNTLRGLQAGREDNNNLTQWFVDKWGAWAGLTAKTLLIDVGLMGTVVFALHMAFPLVAAGFLLASAISQWRAGNTWRN